MKNATLIRAPTPAATRASPTAPVRVTTAATDNAGRTVIVWLNSPTSVSIAEIEVFGSLLAELEAEAANDNFTETASQ